MPSKHSDDTQAVTYRFDKVFVARLRAAAASRGEDIKALVIRALTAELDRVERDS